jgi:cysteine synthase A
MTGRLTRDMIERARAITEETKGFWTDQLRNTDPIACYHLMAGEIWDQTGGKVDGFVQAVGSAASLRGNAERLRECNARVTIVAVEPAESPVLSGGEPGSHKIDGIGAGFVVPLWRDGIADRIERVSTADANAMALRLAREEGLFCGTSTGANVIAALRLAEQMDKGATIVTVMCDTGMKYLKTLPAARPLLRSDWRICLLPAHRPAIWSSTWRRLRSESSLGSRSAGWRIRASPLPGQWFSRSRSRCWQRRCSASRSKARHDGSESDL